MNQENEKAFYDVLLQKKADASSLAKVFALEYVSGGAPESRAKSAAKIAEAELMNTLIEHYQQARVDRLYRA